MLSILLVLNMHFVLCSFTDSFIDDANIANLCNKEDVNVEIMCNKEDVIDNAVRNKDDVVNTLHLVSITLTAFG